jgi:sulfoxide reductase heme-binding subunit YedZ
MMTHLFWYLARSSGFLTYLCAWGSVAWGLLLTTRLAPRVEKATLYVVHRLLGMGSSIFLGVHLYTLYLDPWANFSVRELVVPFGTDYRPFWMACGIVAAYCFVAIVVSSIFQARLPVVLWRGIHYLSFLSFFLGLVHGIGTGTDTRQPWAIGCYGLTAAIVAGLCWVRFTARRQSTVRASAARPVAKRIIRSDANSV